MTPPVTTEAFGERKPTRRTLIQAQARRHYEHVCRLHEMIRTLEGALQQVTAERDEARDLAYELKLAAAGGEDVPGSANLVTPEDVRRWRDEDTRQLATATAEIARLRERLEIAHAYDGAGNKIPFPEGMEHLDGIECRDETIRNLEEQIARLRAEGEAKDRALKEIENLSQCWTMRDRITPEDVVVRDDGQHFKVLALNGVGLIARAARAATAREG